jgi:hypothetical protein
VTKEVVHFLLLVSGRSGCWRDGDGDGAGGPGDPAMVGREGAGCGAAAAVRHQCVPGDGDDAVRGAHFHVRGDGVREAAAAQPGDAVQVRAHPRRHGVRQLGLPAGAGAGPHVQRAGSLPVVDPSRVRTLLAFGPDHRPSAGRLHRSHYQGTHNVIT